MKDLPIKTHPSLLMGLESSSDASVYRLNEDLAIVQSVDFFTPIVDDPYEFGQIAAANSLSDIYAIGGRPITALNIVCFPLKELPMSMLKDILRGGIDKVTEAGALVVGGHSVEDPEPKYGLSVTGIVDPKRFVTNRGARPGDVLVLTKPIGTGVLATAYKGGLLGDKIKKKMVEIMTQLNKWASEAMMEIGANGATDITGFGLVGHALEMAQASDVVIEIESSNVPVIEEALEFIEMGMIPEGDYANRNFCEKSVEIRANLPRAKLDILFDAQTSGGLLISIPEEKAQDLLGCLLSKGVEGSAIIGRVRSGVPKVRIL